MKGSKLLMLVSSICLVLIMGVVLFGAGCTPKAAPPVEPIKIGALLDYTGPCADYGPLFEAGIRLRLEEANYEVAGRPIELIIEDGATDATVSLDKTRKLVESDGVKIIIGPLMGGIEIALAPYLAENKITAFSLINVEHAIVPDGNWIGYPSTTWGAQQWLGPYAYEELGYRKIATIGMDYAAGYNYLGGMVARFKDSGGIVVQEQWAPVGTMDYGPYIAAISPDAEAVATFIIGAEMFLKQCHEFGVEIPVLYTSATTVFSLSELQEFGDLMLGTIGIGAYTWTIDNPANKRFVEAFQAKYGRNPGEHPSNCYVNTSIVLAGLEATGGDDSLDKLRPAMLGLKLDTPQGPLSIDSNGVCKASTHILKIERINGEYAWAVIHTTPPPLYPMPPE